jgi:2',3'-cyclic-nucleotide 2'-phosphodiesterase (5'-nucleotidase family)
MIYLDYFFSAVNLQTNFFIIVSKKIITPLFYFMYRRFSIAALIPLLLTGCSNTTHVAKVETKNYALKDSINSDVDSAMYYKILPYQKSLAADMNAVLAVSDQALEKGQPEGLLGDFVADACLQVTNKTYYPADSKPADFIFLNNGGLRNSLPKGNITKGNVFELMPFENELIVLKINGAVAKKIFNFIASKDGAPVSGVRFGIKDKEAVNIFINNQPFDSTKTYKAVTSDYLANGGDQLFFLANEKERETFNLKVRDAIIQYLQMKSKVGEHIFVKADQRISHVN